MIKTTTKLKSWGNSIGVVLPKDKLDRALLDVGDEVEINVVRKSFALKKIYGALKKLKPKSKKSIQSIVTEVSSELGE